eukprot:Sspe_Gene.82719::Locus_54220_Transcript_2_5_Confidence_0.286_Length_1411::g.82719::m.82719/K00939/adk, AK; adenylate kinase
MVRLRSPAEFGKEMEFGNNFLPPTTLACKVGVFVVVVVTIHSFVTLFVSPPLEPTITNLVNIHKAPLSSVYADRHNLQALFGVLWGALHQKSPEDPVSFLISAAKHITAPKVIITGAPASGKGTQCEMLVKAFGFVHISTGDLLREEVRKKTALGREANGYMKNGKLVPDSLVINLVKKRLSDHEVQRRGWLLDGFPRTVPQAEMLKKEGIHPNSLVVLDVPDEEVINRIEGRRIDPRTNTVYHLKYRPPPKEIIHRLQQRSDDTREKIQERLRSYHSNLNGLLKSFNCDIHRVPGKGSPKEIFGVIVKLVQLSRWRMLSHSLGVDANHTEVTCGL